MTGTSAARVMARGRSVFGVCAAVAVTAGVVSATAGLPVAHADPLGDIRGRVNGARASSTCPALNYSVALEGEAQALTGNTLQGVPPTGQYKGTFTPFTGDGDPAQTAEIHAEVKADSAIHDCANKDFGVGFFREGENDRVAIVLGQPAAPAQQQAPQPVKCPDGSTVPAGQQCPATPAAPQTFKCPAGSLQDTVPIGQLCTPPNDAITMFVSRDGGKAIVQVTNGSALPAKCAYSGTPVDNPLLPTINKSIDVGAHGQNTVPNLLWPPLFTTYTAAVTCTATWDNHPVQIGQASQPVSG